MTTTDPDLAAAEADYTDARLRLLTLQDEHAAIAHVLASLDRLLKRHQLVESGAEVVDTLTAARAQVFEAFTLQADRLRTAHAESDARRDRAAELRAA